MFTKPETNTVDGLHLLTRIKELRAQTLIEAGADRTNLTLWRFIEGLQQVITEAEQSLTAKS